MSESLEELRRKILERHQMEELLNPGRDKKINEKLAKGIRDIPVSQFIEKIQYLEKELLPGVEKKRGKDSFDYIFFSEVVRLLTWAIVLADRYDFLRGEHVSQKVTMRLQHENLQILYRELEKYQTLEDLFLTDAIDKYMDGVKARIDAVSKGTKPR